MDSNCGLNVNVYHPVSPQPPVLIAPSMPPMLAPPMQPVLDRARSDQAGQVKAPLLVPFGLPRGWSDPTSIKPSQRLGNEPLAPPLAGPLQQLWSMMSQQTLRRIDSSDDESDNEYSYSRLPHLPSMESVVSNIQQRLRLGSDLTFRCPFCFENVHVEEHFMYSQCGQQEHGVCKDCVCQHVEMLVNDSRVDAIVCHECKAPATDVEVKEMVSEEVYDKFLRFRQMQRIPDMRECPQCKVLCQPTRDEKGQVLPLMMCHACSKQFCFYHSNAHEGRSCKEYDAAMIREERKMKRILQDTKKCPVCGIITEKIAGCNHMTCQHCESNWCWVCGKEIDNVGGHYAAGAITGCNQFSQPLPGGFEQYIATTTLPMRLLSVLVAVVVLFVHFLAFVALFLVMLPMQRLRAYFGFHLSDSLVKDCIKRAYFFSCIVFIPLEVVILCAWLLAWLIPAIVLWLLIAPCGARRIHFLRLLTDSVVFLSQFLGL